MRGHPHRIVSVLVVIAALAAVGCGSGSRTAAQPRKPLSRTGPQPWNPLQRQVYDAATTFLFDAANARTQTPGNGGLMMGNSEAGGLPWRANSKVVMVPGRYRSGIRSTDSESGFLWMPVTGILSPKAFTIEFWAKSSVPFESADGAPVSVAGVSFRFSKGMLVANFLHSQSYPAVNAAVIASVGSLPPNTWEEFALTYSRQRLALYVNGRPTGSESAVPAPQVWSDINRGGGLTIGGADGRGATEFAVSDLRVSRVARVPGHPLSAVPATLSITTAPAREVIRQSLLGGLHTLTTPATVRMARGVLRVIRTDKLINSTPIKRGPPDRAHPSRGVSGMYSYNWQVVDHTVKYLHDLGVDLYLSIDATPQLLGGASPPLAGAQLRSARSFVSGFAPQVPDDLHAWQLIVEDFAFRILKQDRIPVAYWGVWNEPDGPDFWSGTLNQYLGLYRASIEGVRAVDPRAVVGGAETASWDPQWVSSLMAFCASQRVPLNFVSWHYYSGDLGEIPEAQATVAALAARYRIPRPFLNIGEWAWQTANLPRTGALPFKNENYFLNDWSAAFIAASLMEMQRNDVAASVYTNPVASGSGSGFDGAGLMSATEPWAAFNVYRLWHRLPAQELKTKLDADPGIFAIAAKDTDRLAVLVASQHYQLGQRFPLTLQFPRRLARHKATVWLIDRHHADAYDAGSRYAQMRPRSAVLSGDAQLRASLLPRAVALVEVSLR